MWPGNTADVGVLLPIVDRLRTRFAIGRVCVVADRGMISAATIAALEERGLEYVLGARERTDSLVRRIVLEDTAALHAALRAARQRGETQLWVKEVVVEGRRYVVCRNEAEANKDAADRKAVLDGLERAAEEGRQGADRQLGLPPLPQEHRQEGVRDRPRQGGGRGSVRRHLCPAHERQDHARCRRCYAIATCSRSRTCSGRPKRFCAPGRSTTRPMLPFAAMCSARSWRWCCGRSSTTAAGRWTSGPNGRRCQRDLDRLQEVEIAKDGKRLILRTPVAGTAGRLFQAVRVALPPNVREHAAAA